MFFFSFFFAYLWEKSNFSAPVTKSIFFFFSINFYGNIVDLQYCESVSS